MKKRKINPGVALAQFFLACAAQAKKGPIAEFFVGCAKAALK